MGQKVNPVGLRLGINKFWDSKWCVSDRDFAAVLDEDFRIRKFLEKEVDQAGISSINIERSGSRVSIVMNVARPGVVIGKKGSYIEHLRSKLVGITKKDVSLNIVGVKKPELDAKLVADSIAKQLEKRVSFRKAMKKAVQQCLNGGGKGIRVNCGGRLGGAEIARTEWYREGRVPLHTLRSDIDYNESTAHTSYGCIGVKVWIYRGDITDLPA